VLLLLLFLLLLLLLLVSSSQELLLLEPVAVHRHPDGSEVTAQLVEGRLSLRQQSLQLSSLQLPVLHILWWKF
jgi:hypothetical protein